MRLVTNITDALQFDNYCERELKNIHHNTNVASPRHIKDYGTMSKALLRLRNHGIVIRFKRRNQDTGRKNWYYALNVNDAQLAAYLERKQKQFDYHVGLARAKYGKKVDAIRSMASLPSDPMAQIYAMTTDERIKAFIEEARPDLKPAPVEQYPNVFKFADATKVGDAIFSITSHFNDTPLCLGWGLAPHGLIGKCLVVDSSYKANIIREYGNDVIYFTKATND